MADFSLASIEVEGFRGFNKKQTFPLDDYLTIVSGNNGVGKSSLLGSVEWCLYGDVKFINYLDSKVRDELVNQSHLTGMAQVTLTLRKGPDTYEIERSKKLGTRNTQITLRSSSGQFDDSLAEEELYKLFGLTLDDFIRAVYLHQESVRGLLTDDPKTRDEALDRLFGLDRLRNLVEGIPIKDIRDEVDNLNGKKEKLGEKIKGALIQIQLDLSRLREKAKDLGISEEEIGLEKAISLAKSAREIISQISKEYGLPEYSIPVPAEFAQLGSVERKAKQALKEYETSMITSPEVSEDQGQRRKIDDLLEDRRRKLEQKAAKQQQLSPITSKYGSAERISSELDGVNAKLKELDEGRKILDAHSRLLEDAIQELGMAEVRVCPVCNQIIDHGKVLSRLKIESERHLGEEVRKIDEDRSSLVKKRDELKGIQETLNAILEDVRKNEEAVAVIDTQLNNFLGTKLKNDALIAAAGARVQELQRRIDEMEQAYSTRAKKIQDARQLLEQVSAISGVLEKSSEFEEVNRHFQDESSQIQSIDNAIAELQKLERTLETIIRAVSEVQIGLASEMIKKAEGDISAYYSRLCNHPYYDRIRVEVRPREIRGLVRNSYSIKASNNRDSKETFVSSRFSTGQMNCVALAIYLALTKVLPVSFRFIFLDDPSQNLDPSHKQALVSILKEVLRDRQVVVASHDSELFSYMRSEIQAHTEYSFSNGNFDGPKVTVEKRL